MRRGEVEGPSGSQMSDCTECQHSQEKTEAQSVFRQVCSRVKRQRWRIYPFLWISGHREVTESDTFVISDWKLQQAQRRAAQNKLGA